MDRKTEIGIWKVKREIYKEASVSSTRFRFKLKMEVNLLDYAIGGVFLMEFEDGTAQLVIKYIPASIWLELVLNSLFMIYPNNIRENVINRIDIPCRI